MWFVPSCVSGTAATRGLAPPLSSSAAVMSDQCLSYLWCCSVLLCHVIAASAGYPLAYLLSTGQAARHGDGGGRAGVRLDLHLPTRHHRYVARSARRTVLCVVVGSSLTRVERTGALTMCFCWCSRWFRRPLLLVVRPSSCLCRHLPRRLL